MSSNEIIGTEILYSNCDEETPLPTAATIINENLVFENCDNENQDEWYEDDLQLAAELGKTLLERNKELEGSLRQQQLVIEDQAQVIEYLSKQTTALREVNDSRLKIYEQLESSIQELEKSNQRLQHESNSDKKKIKSLLSNIENLEKRCEELESLETELKNLKQQRKLEKKRERRRTTLGYFESETLHKTFGHGSGLLNDDNDNPEAEVKSLQKTMCQLRSKKNEEQEKREQLEVEVAYLLRENETLSDEVACLHRREVALKAIESDLQSLEEFSAQGCGNVCRYCHRQLKNERMSLLMNTDVEEEECAPSIGVCSLAKLKNGVVAYGSQESLLSLGATVFDGPKCPPTETEEVLKETTLLNELDTQYRNLIEKYESLIGVQKQANGDLDSDDNDGCCRNLNSVDSLSSDSSKAEASSLSSGFSSDGDITFVNKMVQTDPVDKPICIPATAITPKGKRGANPVDRRFNRSPPEYKKLFKDIFAVLKTPVQWDEACSSTEESHGDGSSREAAPPPMVLSTPVEIPQASDEKSDRKKEIVSGGFKNYNVCFPLAPRQRQSGATEAVALLRRTYAEVLISGDNDKRESANVKSKKLARKMKP